MKKTARALVNPVLLGCSFDLISTSNWADDSTDNGSKPWQGLCFLNFTFEWVIGPRGKGELVLKTGASWKSRFKAIRGVTSRTVNGYCVSRASKLLSILVVNPDSMTRPRTLNRSHYIPSTLNMALRYMILTYSHHNRFLPSLRVPLIMKTSWPKSKIF